MPSAATAANIIASPEITSSNISFEQQIKDFLQEIEAVIDARDCNVETINTELLHVITLTLQHEQRQDAQVFPGFSTYSIVFTRWDDETKIIKAVHVSHAYYELGWDTEIVSTDIGISKNETLFSLLSKMTKELVTHDDFTPSDDEFTLTQLNLHASLAPDIKPLLRPIPEENN